ncbi:uncharacterized protein LOC133744257 [Rosa rugosa]|uniref:uncharacterized protein LOC133744257 n=1 Tax=Rosa rugosa TaxID=74645 RepID=UPI002B409EBE|nr:uncharacterized protein LOC133744257 [Rosa rugosa]
MWNVVENGWVHPTKLDNPKASESSYSKRIPKPRAEWSETEIRDCNHDFKARNSLFTALSKKERVRISHCETAKKAWDLLQVTYEGNKRVRTQKLQRLVLEFENMSMGTDESIDDFHARLINVTSQCHSLGDPFEEHRIVKKFLRSLPPSFQSKQTAIEEAQDIDTYSLDELVGNLKTFEMRINPEKKVKSVAFNSVKKEEETEVSTKDLAYLTKQFKKFFKSRNSSGQGSKNSFDSSSKRSLPSENSFERNSKSNKLFQKKNFSEKPKCFECGEIGHLAADCGNKKYSSRMGKALKSTWSDSESDTHSENEEENLALTSTLHNESSHESDDEEYSDEEMDGKYKELYAASRSILKKNHLQSEDIVLIKREKKKAEDRLESCIKEWESERSDLVDQVKTLQAELKSQTSLASSLASENESLKLELEDAQQKFSKFSIGSNKVSKMIGMGKPDNDKKGLGYNAGENSKPLNFVKSLGVRQPEKERRGLGFIPYNQVRCPSFERNSFVRQVGHSSWSRNFTPVCHYCGTPGHIRPRCNLLRRESQKLWNSEKENKKLSLQTKLKEHLREVNRIAKLVSIPNGLDPKLKQVWVKKDSYNCFSSCLNDSSVGSEFVDATCLFSSIYSASNDFEVIEETCLVALTARSARRADTWYVDSRCSRHMTGDKSWLVSFSDEYTSGSVTFGDGRKANVIEKGIVNTPGIPNLKNVLYVEGLQENLISVSQLNDDYEDVNFNK